LPKTLHKNSLERTLQPQRIFKKAIAEVFKNDSSELHKKATIDVKLALIIRKNGKKSFFSTWNSF